ncbi:MAG TPA: aldehyde ferredoxin oxidoreductase [Methanomicrobia archaeon]|nr:aldehyde ferredoxin oxidoreductase [Methanomicrobia archaeon]
MKGYAGKILFVNLSTGEIKTEKTEDDLARKFLGGVGFGAKYLFDLCPKGADPLGPDNVIAVGAGPISGTFLHGAGRGTVVTKSPLTGGYMRGAFGGDFAAKLKYAGYDSIIITGEADSPKYLYIDDDTVELRDAGGLWGLDTKEVQEKIEELTASDFSTLCIGPGGENKVRYACVIHDVRACGRGGMGAVFGAKKLKAITVRGSKDVEVADLGKMFKHYNELIPEYETKGKGLTDYGTPILVNIINNQGSLGTYNYQKEQFERAEEISGEKLKAEHWKRNDACFACRIACTKIDQAKSDPAVTEGPEYESLYSLGSMCGVDDLDTLIRTDALCDELGLDTISFGLSVSFMMEAQEKGLLGDVDLSGLDFSWGNREALYKVCELTGKAEGVGEFVGLGTREMAKKLGGDAYKFAIHIKGLEPAGHSGRGIKTMSIGYSVSNRGGSHHDARPSMEYGFTREQREDISDKAEIAFDTANWTTFGDAAVICHLCEKSTGLVLTENYVRWVNDTIGWDLTLEELTEIADRIYTMERAFNCREGITRKDDKLPWRFMNEPIPDGPLKGMYCPQEELDQMLDRYYELRGWNENGIPTKERLEKFGIGYVADQLEY